MKLRIGIPLIQNELNGRTGWIAGYYFIKNCLNAIGFLPESEIPEVVVFVPESFNEPFFGSTLPINWLKVVKIPDDQLRDVSQYTAVENTINSYQCNIIFPFLTIPTFILKGMWIGWIPDFQDRYLKHNFSVDELNFRGLSAGFILSHCDKILCTSRAVNSDIKQFYPTYAANCRIINFRSVIENEYLNIDPSAVLTQYGLQGRKYIYLPNQFWVHKNHKLVFEAWSQLKKSGFDYLLVCTGAEHDYRFPDYFKQLTSYVKEQELSDNIKLLGFVERSQQIQLYRGAAAILQPSLFEGWSTSLEDAKAMGKFTIVSDLPIHKEQCKSNVVFFHSHDPSSLAKVIREIWDQLPTGYAKDLEQSAFIEYQHLVRDFGNDLVNLFLTTFNERVASPSLLQSNHESRLLTLELIVFFQKRFISIQKECEERLVLLNLLDKELAGRSLIGRALDRFFRLFKRS